MNKEEFFEKWGSGAWRAAGLTEGLIERSKPEFMADLDKVISREMEDKFNAGERAEEYGIPIGTIGCPSCGFTVHGALDEPVCQMCSKPYWPVKEDKDG